MKKFDVVLMNPPYDNKQQFLDMDFVRKCNKISNIQVVIHPAKRWVSNTKIGKENAESGHLRSLEILDGNEIFNISTRWKYIGIFEYDNTTAYKTCEISFKDTVTNIECDDFSKRNTFYGNLDFSNELISLIESREELYKSLLTNYNTMVNDGHGFVYEETRLYRGKKKYNIKKDDNIGLTYDRRDHYRRWLKEGKYKYCLYKGSYNHAYDELQEWNGEDPYKLFNGHILWLTNSLTVKNNLKYWMESPLFDLWRMYKFKLRSRNNNASGCSYGELPALDFEMSEDKFKIFVNNLNNFSEREIQILRDNKIHNSDKL